ncbi:surface-associated interspersed protein (SURFIN) [Plasmodium relictum]|uniref:Surface-associated interspersed protein (SURFIN) n=1 Tax=Plasmodium relictum TaxID=85471 RepID=A0A1J1GMT2_PLARL|nr:surface-associated interspersed protein (SURFIN) [Plasmodium relictum]CRG84446.1 surface-associated interspersed protein (SURFIN) [Plasmodium relictum]
MNTEKKIDRRKARSASKYGHQYETWKNQVTSDFNNELQNINIERDITKKRKSCRDFNNNVDDTKEDFMGVKVIDLQVEGNPEEAWKEIEQHINNKISQFPNLQCKRIPSNYPKAKRNKRNKIVDFCEERDKHFHSLKMKKTNDECLNYNQWINDEKNKFLNNNPWSISDSMGNDQAFKISRNCTLINMSMFSNEDCSKYNSRPSNSLSQQRSFSPLVTTQTPNRKATPIKTTLHTITLNPTTASIPAQITIQITTLKPTNIYIPKNTSPPVNASTSAQVTTKRTTSTNIIQATSNNISTSTDTPTTKPKFTFTTTPNPVSTTEPTTTQATTSNPVSTTESTTTQATTPNPASTTEPTTTQATTSNPVSTTESTTTQATTPNPASTTEPTTTSATTQAITSNPVSTTEPTTTSANVPIIQNTSLSQSTFKPTIISKSTTTSTPSTTQAITPTIMQATACKTTPLTTSASPSAKKTAKATASTNASSSTLSTTLSTIKQNSNVTLTNFKTITSVNNLPASIHVHNTSYGNMSSGISIKSSSTPTKSIIIPLSFALGSFLGILLLFIFVYRCTPIGSWLGNSRSKKKRIRKKKKEVQIDSAPIFLGFSDKKSEINMKNFSICNEANSFTCEIRLENEININERYGKEESKENKNEEKREKTEKAEKRSERNIEKKSNVVARTKKWKWKAVIEVYMIILEEFQKEEWELNRREFLKICLEEFKEDIYLDVINRHLNMGADQEEITSIFLEQRPLWKIWAERNNKLIEKWKKEHWFKNLKREWKKEVNKYVELIEKEEMMEGKENGEINPMLERQKIIWKKWMQKQKMSRTFDNDELLKQLLVEYQTEEEMKKSVETIDKGKIKREIEKKNKANNDLIKNKLISRLKIEIHMMVLDECKKEEWIGSKKEFLKTCIEELKMQNSSDEKTKFLEIEEEIMKNIILGKKKNELEKMKKEKCFIELKQEWKNKEKKYMEELNKENLSGDNEERIENSMLQKQKIIWKKHWEEIHKKLEDENKKECFIKLMEELEKKEINIKEIDKINVVEKNIKENEIVKEKKKEYIQLEKKEEIYRKDEKVGKKKKKKIKHMEGKVEEVKEKNNYMALRKKPKRKTIIEIHMMIMQDCKEEEWELNRVEFLEICLNEWLKNEGIIKNVMDKKVMLKGEKESNNVALEKKKMLSKKWIERQRRLLEKWEKEEWFKNLKEEWKMEEDIYAKTKDKLDFIDRQDKIESNPTLERKKEIWKQWIQRQREAFMEHYKEGWFRELLEEYEKEECEFIKEENEKNVEEEKNYLENERREVAIVDIKKEVNNNIKKKRLISNMCVEIHMMVLDQCKKEEIESMTNEFLKLCIEQKKEHEGSREQEVGNKEVDEVEKKREMNIMIKKKKEKWECWKKEDWFQELKLNWKKEMIHMKEITDNIREKVVNPMLETQIIEKHWQEKQRNILKKRNKQNKHERSMKKNKDEEKIGDKNDEDGLKEWNITIL